MPNLGAIGRITEAGFQFLTPRGPRGFLGGVLAGIEFPMASRWTADGNPTAPAERQDRRGMLRTIFWPVEAGDRVFTIRLHHGGNTPTPRLILKATPDIGVLADVVAEATSSTAWQELQVSATVVTPGVLEIWREVRSLDQNAYAIWDHLVPE